jgi:hypothetical protein
VCYDSDYDENDFQAPDQYDEPDTLDECVPCECLFTKPKNSADKKPTKIAKCTCGWFCELPESHIEHSKWSGCDYINAKYNLSYDSDSEIHGTLKPSNEKKPTKKIPKDGIFDTCGYTGKNAKSCGCVSCNPSLYARKSGSCVVKFSHKQYEEKWLATKLEVKFAD